MNKRNLVTLLSIVMIMTACNNNGFQKTESGIEYKKHKTVENAKKLNSGDIALIQYSMGTKDSILQNETPEFLILISQTNLSPDLFEIFTLLDEGDSITALIEPIAFYQDSLRIPTVFKGNDKMYFNVKVNKAYTEEEYKALLKAKTDSLLKIETVLLQEYLTQNKLKGEATESGLIIVTVKEGKGEKAEPGKTVTVNYAGYLLDGTKFDSSYDRGTPFEFPLGVGSVIQGWDEAIATMKVGGKAKLLIPSQLAYGDNDTGGVIPPNSPLIFDVELIQVR